LHTEEKGEDIPYASQHATMKTRSRPAQVPDSDIPPHRQDALAGSPPSDGLVKEENS
jgi:hypothetical protein